MHPGHDGKNDSRQFDLDPTLSGESKSKEEADANSPLFELRRNEEASSGELSAFDVVF